MHFPITAQFSLGLRGCREPPFANAGRGSWQRSWPIGKDEWGAPLLGAAPANPCWPGSRHSPGLHLRRGTLGRNPASRGVLDCRQLTTMSSRLTWHLPAGRRCAAPGLPRQPRCRLLQCHRPIAQPVPHLEDQAKPPPRPSGCHPRNHLRNARWRRPGPVQP